MATVPQSAPPRPSGQLQKQALAACFRLTSRHDACCPEAVQRISGCWFDATSLIRFLGKTGQWGKCTLGNPARKMYHESTTMLS